MAKPLNMGIKKHEQVVGLAKARRYLLVYLRGLSALLDGEVTFILLKIQAKL